MLVEDQMIEKIQLAGIHSPVEGKDDEDDFPCRDVMNNLDEVEEEVEGWAVSICKPTLLDILETRGSSTAATNGKAEAVVDTAQERRLLKQTNLN